MPRTKPKERLDVIGKLEEKVTTSIAEFIVSKECCETDFLKPANQDNFPETPESFYLSCVREYEIYREIQKQVLAENKRLEIVNSNRHEELCSDQLMLRQKFVQSALKLKELKEKEESVRSIKDQEALVQQKAIEKSKEHRSSMATLKLFRVQFQNTVNEYDIYEDFMNAFLKEYPKYGTADAFINKMDALMLANVDIKDMNESLILKLNAMKLELVTITRDIANSLMQMKNEMDFFQRAFVRVCSEVNELEENLTKIRFQWIKRENEKHRLTEGLYNVYLLLIKRRRLQPVLRTTEIDKMCMYLKNEFDVLTYTFRYIMECFRK
ncbi:uncharacterized protein LOC119672619 isoform X2 [Teleopsis dalmanni]|nr:uncharacterized protein LOC119672619 isoform X2 [Teleopsis dalmanni]XP_037939645.1 uncharacterized protein LOC119672619 isoform X2 [Teleopsis dalmanni]